LQEFEGAMIIVSHDRHLLRTVSDTLLLVADGKVSPFDGDLDDYRQWVKEQVQKSEVADKSDEKTPGAAAINKKQLRQDAAERRRQLQPQRNKVKKLEQQMEKLGEEKARLEEQLADNSLYSDENKDKLRQLLEQQATVTQQLQDVEEQWLEAGEALEALQD
jgi:ATP-binding cassette subfamily F protein 3